MDIVLETRTQEGKRIVIDFHGYNHFFRNNENLKGNAVFKRKILEKLNCVYVEVRIMDWLLLDDNGKIEYMRNVLKDHLSGL